MTPVLYSSILLYASCGRFIVDRSVIVTFFFPSCSLQKEYRPYKFVELTADVKTLLEYFFMKLFLGYTSAMQHVVRNICYACLLVRFGAMMSMSGGMVGREEDESPRAAA